MRIFQNNIGGSQSEYKRAIQTEKSLLKHLKSELNDSRRIRSLLGNFKGNL